MGEERKIIAQAFMDMAQGLETGSFERRPRIAVTGIGGEHGEQTLMEGAQMAAKGGVDVYYIGTLEAQDVTTVKAADEEECHKLMEEMLENGEIDGAVTMHYPFPIGVSTVGRVVTPARGRQMFVANTTGTSGTDRVEAMVKNSICGIIAAKACGIAEPAVGLLNLDGARQAELALRELQKNGYDIRFAESARTDGGAVMRGNDMLMGSADVMVMDSLTGNVMMKMLSSYTTGGVYEAAGWGYGPGIGQGFDKLILILSRASGAPVVANAILYGAELIKGRILDVMKEEFAKAQRAGLSRILSDRKTKPASDSETITAPPAEPAAASIEGIDVMDLEEAVRELWKQGIYAESGMGCTGPLVMISEANHKKAAEILKKAGYTG
ncbi:MAG: glycine reductase [Clostridia bacterium]|nr:glycine reductase [Clostridia bacterium]